LFWGNLIKNTLTPPMNFEGVSSNSIDGKRALAITKVFIAKVNNNSSDVSKGLVLTPPTHWRSYSHLLQ
jgi:hypothetical protein